MKVIVKKRVVSRKKPLRTVKSKPVSTKRVKPRKPAKSSKSTVKNKVNPYRYVKGQSGNPAGRKKGSKNKFSVTDMKNALEKAAIKAGYTSTYAYVAERFFADDHVLTAIMKKVLADLKSMEQITIAADSMSKQKADDIRKKMKERFG